VRPLLWLVLGIVAWVVFWGVLTRLFSGRSRLGSHVTVALCGIAVFLTLDVLRDWASYALSNRALADYGYVCRAVVAAIFVYFHLRLVSSGLRAYKFGVVSVLTLCACAALTLAGWPDAASERSSGAWLYPAHLYPPSWIVAPGVSEERFFDRVEKLKAEIEAPHDAP